MSSSGYVPLCSFVLKAVGVPVCAAKLLSHSPAQAAAILEARDSPPLSICLNRSSSPSLLSSDLSMGECVSSACQAKDANTFGRRPRDHAFAFNAMSIFASGLPFFSRMYVGLISLLASLFYPVLERYSQSGFAHDSVRLHSFTI
jgi:hypothetical protein